MSVKKSILSASALALAVTTVVGGTLAYQNSEVPTDINTMVAGGVEIKQTEWERAVDADGNWITSEYTGYGYTADLMQPFTQGKSIAPAVYEDDKVKWDDRNGNQNPSGEGSHQQPWSQIGAPGSNQLFDDSVKNVIDKFVFVQNTGEKDAYYRTVVAIECPAGFDNSNIHTNLNGNSRFSWTDWETITVDGVQYIMAVATHTETLKSGEYSRPSLLQLYLDPETSNEQIKLLGDTWEVLVMSQANQTDGFDTAADSLNAAFGEITAETHPWSDFELGTVAYDVESLTDAVAEGGTVTLTGEIIADNADSSAAEKYSAITIDEDTTLDGNGTIENTGYAISVKNLDASEELPTLTINGGNYIGATSAVNVVTGNLVINGGFFKDSNTEDNGHYLINCIDANYKNGTATVTITGGTFVNWNPADNTSEGAGTNFVAPGYTVTSETKANGDVWYTVVAE